MSFFLGIVIKKKRSTFANISDFGCQGREIVSAHTLFQNIICRRNCIVIFTHTADKTLYSEVTEIQLYLLTKKVCFVKSMDYIGGFSVKLLVGKRLLRLSEPEYQFFPYGVG